MLSTLHQIEFCSRGERVLLRKRCLAPAAECMFPIGCKMLYAMPKRGRRQGRRVYRLEQERDEDWWEVEALYDLCFAPGREALSSYRLRDDIAPVREFCLVARDPDSILAAAIRYWPVRIAGWEALLVGPIAVHPTRQGEGLGALVITDSLERADKSGWERVMLVGDAPYYGRFGFTRLDGVEMPPPTNPDRVLGTGDWDGVAGKVTRWSEQVSNSPL